MPFDQFLQSFWEKLGPQRVQDRVRGHLEQYFDLGEPSPSRVKDALDYVFGSERSRLDSYRPTQAQTRDFIDYLLFAVRAESKDLSPDRCLALSNVLHYNERPGPVCFAGVDPAVFAFQLGLRIREPSLLNQKSLGVCGAASLITSFAKHTPSAFADYAISLVRHGRAMFHGMTISPGAKIMAGEYSEKMAEVDIVTMGSLATGFFGSVQEGKSAPGMCKWLREAGYTNVHDKTFLTDFGEASLDMRLTNLRGAEAAIGDGKLVIMCVHAGGIHNPVLSLKDAKGFFTRNWGTPALQRESGDSVEPGRGIRVPGGLQPRSKSSKVELHWIVVTRLQVRPDEVSIKLYSWQQSMEGTFPLQPFLTYYEGYLVADPPAPEERASS